MKNKKSSQFYFRLIHRYLGFFLVGIMSVYAISGIILIFRDTDFLKSSKIIEKKIEPNLASQNLGRSLRIRGFKATKQEKNIIYFKQGMYDKQTGIANYTVKELPTIVSKMIHLHKSSTKDKLYWLNIFFGVSLLFFSISAFWMYLPNTKTFKKGLYFTFGGIVLTLILIFV